MNEINKTYSLCNAVIYFYQGEIYVCYLYDDFQFSILDSESEPIRKIVEDKKYFTDLLKSVEKNGQNNL